MRNVTAPQIQKIHVLLRNLGISDHKKEIVFDITDGRTVSTKELTIDEARVLITRLSENDPNNRLKSVIFSLAYQAGIIYGSTPDDRKMNAAKLSMFLRDRGAVKKDLNDMDYRELVKTHRQFEAIVRNTVKSSDNKAAGKLVKELLEDLNIIQ